MIPKRTTKKSIPGFRLLSRLGPGLITGASDDDPSGIATYTQAGAQLGFDALWMMVFSYPLMVAVQEISARIGRITGAGLTANMKKYFPRPFVTGMVLLVVVANVCNIGADIGAMGDCATLLLPGPSWLYIAIFGLGSLLLEIFVTYKKYVDYLKWLTLAVIAYVVTAFFVHIPWQNALKSTFWPSFSWHPDYFETLIAVLGTTISPYLFFGKPDSKWKILPKIRKSMPSRSRLGRRRVVLRGLGRTR